jgi:polysaccharide transporter, PST family
MIKQVVFNYAVLIVQYVVTGLVPLILIPHLVRTIGLSAYGDLAVAMAVAAYGTVLVQYAFSQTGPKRIAQLLPGETTRGVFKEITFAKTLLLIPALVAMTMASAVIPTSDHTHSQWLLLGLLPIAAVFHSGWQLQSSGHFIWVCIISIFSAGVAVFIGFRFVQASGTEAVLTASITLVAGPLLAGIGTLAASLLLLRSEATKPHPTRPLNAMRDGWPLFVSQFTAALYGASGPLVIRYAAGAEAAGAYGSVDRVVSAVVGVCLLGHTAAYPKLASLYNTDRAAYWRLLHFVIFSYLAFAFTIAVGALSLSLPLKRYLFGADFLDGAEALILWGLAWIVLGVFGTALTGYFTVSSQQKQVLPLTLKILFSALIVGIPAVFFLGSWAWMAALVLSQFHVLRTFFQVYRKEYLTSGK